MFICFPNLNSYIFSSLEPDGYYFRSEGLPSKFGGMVYSYPDRVTSDVDDIVLGVMTDEPDAVLVRLESVNSDDYIELKLVSHCLVDFFSSRSRTDCCANLMYLEVSNKLRFYIKIHLCPWRHCFLFFSSYLKGILC